QAYSYAHSGEAMLTALVRPVEEGELPYGNAAFTALDRELRERAAELGRRRGVPQEALAQLVNGAEHPGAFADMVAFHLDVPAAEKQELLEVFGVEERMRRVLVAVERGPLRRGAQLVNGVEHPGAFADMVAFHLDVSAAEKQELLEVFGVEERMRRVLVAVERDLLRLEAQQEIQQRVQEELGDKQREMVLREQLK